LLYGFINDEAVKDVKNKKETTGKKKVTVKNKVNWWKSNKHFRSIIDFINKNTKAQVLKDNVTDAPITTEYNETLLPVGSKVLVALDQPTSIETGKRNFGDFRATDTRWKTDVETITFIQLSPGQPPLYKVSNSKSLHTRNQLQIVRKKRLSKKNTGFSIDI
jgi:hypothetical protein